MSQPIVLLAGKSYSTPIVYNSLQAEFDVAAILLEDRVGRGDFLSKRVKRLGWAKVLGQALFRAQVVPYLRASSRSRVAQILAETGLSRAPLPNEKIRTVPSVNSEACIAALREIRPAAVVVNGTRIS